MYNVLHYYFINISVEIWIYFSGSPFKKFDHLDGRSAGSDAACLTLGTYRSFWRMCFYCSNSNTNVFTLQFSKVLVSEVLNNCEFRSNVLLLFAMFKKMSAIWGRNWSLYISISRFYNVGCFQTFVSVYTYTCIYVCDGVEKNLMGGILCIRALHLAINSCSMLRHRFTPKLVHRVSVCPLECTFVYCLSDFHNPVWRTSRTYLLEWNDIRFWGLIGLTWR
jgi:hypothetical protein